MKVITAAALASALSARYPNPGGEHAGVLSEISAGAGKVSDVQAAAVLGYQQNTSKLVYVKATEHFYVGAGNLVQAGDFVQVKEEDGRRIVAAGRGEIATDAEVQAAQTAQPADSKGKK